MRKMSASGRDSKTAILSAAISEFTTYGLAGARVERIARLAGVNKQLLFYYFDSKAGLFEAASRNAVSQALATVTAQAIPPGIADARFRSAFSGLTDVLAQNPQLAQLATQHAGRGAARDPVAQALAALREPLRLVLLEGQAVGFFRDDVDPEFVARLALELVLGHMSAEQGSAWEAAARHTWSRNVADLLLRALAW